MPVLSETADAVRQPRFVVEFATTAEQVLETQQLRYQIFAGELGAHIDGGADGADRDRFDPHCRHLLVRETASGRVVACTRLLSDEGARAAGRFYSEGEFDLEMIRSLPGRVMEIGRTCVHPDFRNGAIIALLWSGIAAHINAEAYDYLFGCASIGLEDGGAAAHAILNTIRDKHLAPRYQRVTPYVSLPAADARPQERVRMPPLLKAYLSLGAKACGEPYWDQDFNCADLFMLLNVSDLHPRYARHFLARNKSETRGARAVHN